MRVLMISKDLVLKAYHKKLEEIAKLGVDLHVVVPPHWGNQKLEVKVGNGYHLYPLKIAFSGKYHFHFYFHLSDLMYKIKPGVVHIDDEPYNFVTFQSMRIAKKIGANTIFFTWQNIYKKYPFPFSLIEKYNLENADIAIAGNEEAKNVLQQKGYNREIVVIPQFGVDPEIFFKMKVSGLKNKLGINKDSFVIGFMGRLVEEKGILLLTEAISKLEGNFCLLLIGDGCLKEKILAESKKNNVENKIFIINQIPSMDVPEYLNLFDCLILPSLTRANWKEQFGRVLIEAMSCKVPVIGSSSGEIPNVIGDAGLIFREGDVDDLVVKIKKIIDEPDLRIKLSKKGRERVLNNYTQKQVAEKTYKVYEKLLA